MYRVDDLPTQIPIGIQTEEGVCVVEFDCAPWLEMWPDMVCSAEHTRPGETYSYPVVCERKGTILRWLVSLVDTELPGQGIVEIVGLATGKRKLSGKTWTYIEETSTANTGEVPAPLQPYIEQATSAATRAEAAATRAEAAATRAEATGGATVEDVLAALPTWNGGDY